MNAVETYLRELRDIRSTGAAGDYVGDVIEEIALAIEGDSQSQAG